MKRQTFLYFRSACFDHWKFFSVDLLAVLFVTYLFLFFWGSHRSKHHKTVFELFPSYWLRRSYSAMNACGRLPVNNTGLVFCSDDGRFSHHITNPSKGLLRTYQFDFTEPLSVEKMRKFQEGVVLDNVPGKLTHFEDVKQISELRWQMSILNDNLIKPMMVAVDV